MRPKWLPSLPFLSRRRELKSTMARGIDWNEIADERTNRESICLNECHWAFACHKIITRWADAVMKNTDT